MLTAVALSALFGEQVTKQYLSESFDLLDHFIFAMAPLGILTAVVSAIRVAGSSGMKALVGRARESRATIEADLMSSTSYDVCELWNGDGVARVLGSPKILELVCDRADSNYRSLYYDRLEDSVVKRPSAGLYPFKEYVLVKGAQSAWKLRSGRQ